MKKRIAVIVCAALMATMLGACGSSAGTSGGQAEASAQEETQAAEETPATEETQAAEATATEETQAAETPAAEETQAVDQDLSQEQVELGEGSVGSENALIGEITPAEGDGDAEITQSGELGGQALGSAPEIEGLESISGAEKSVLNGRTTMYGDQQEYTVFLTYSDSGCMDYVVIFCNPYTRVLTCYAEIVDFYKSAGYTKQQMVDFDINSVYPNFTSMSCSTYAVYDGGSAYRMIITLEELDNPDNLEETVNNGFFYIPGYRYGMLLDADSVCRDLRQKGAYQMSEDEIERANIFK